jgi:glycine cleavage system H protein
MSQILRFPEELFYDDEHQQWVNAAGETVTTGLTDYAQSSAGDVVFVELPAAGAAVEKGQAIGSIESGKWVGRIYAPVSGTVTAVNQALNKDPRTVNRDPYGAGWIAAIRARDLGELQGLLRAEEARARAEAEQAREQGQGGRDAES